jgi:hypothetical protein
MTTCPQAPLATAAGQVFDHIMERYAADFIIHLEITRHEQNSAVCGSASAFTVDHYLFGCFDWEAFDPHRWHPQNRFHRGMLAHEAKQVLSESFEYSKLTLLSNDLIFTYTFRIVHNLPTINIDMASAIFGKGTFYSYFTIVKKGPDWFPYSQYPIGSHFSRFRGSLIRCLALFRQVQATMPHPYQQQINQWRDLYIQQTCRKRVSF